MSIAKNLQKILSAVPKQVALVAVSKTKPVSDILEAYNAGHRIFGENKIQEMVEKYEELPKDIQWHMIGHLQRNKVKYMASFVHLIHGVDSYKTLKEINKQAEKHDRVISCLLQIKIAKEDSKFGLSENDLIEILQNPELNSLNNIKIVGFMGMASFVSNDEEIRTEFRTLKDLFERYKTNRTSNFQPEVVSMGMSGDYTIAIEEGSTMIRVGSSIFGVRNYT